MKPFFSRAIAVGLLVFLSAGCGGEGEPEPDTTEPGIESTVPADGQTGLAPDSDILIQFEESIDRNSINGDIFHLNLDAVPRYGSVSYDLASYEATLSLSFDLEAGATYQAVLEPGIKDLAGNRRKELYQWSFTVAP